MVLVAFNDTVKYWVCGSQSWNKKSNNASAVLLNPLLTPHCPWSHILLDFATGLPDSDGDILVITIVEWFCKMVHIVPLPKLPTTKETAETLLHHVVQLQISYRCCLRQRTPLHFAVLKGFLYPRGSYCEPVIQILHPVQQRLNQEREEESSLSCGPNPSSVEQTAEMGWVCS